VSCKYNQGTNDQTHRLIHEYRSDIIKPQGFLVFWQ